MCPELYQEKIVLRVELRFFQIFEFLSVTFKFPNAWTFSLPFLPFPLRRGIICHTAIKFRKIAAQSCL